MDELKPCPFCGKEPSMWYSMDDANRAKLMIYCKNCDAKTEGFKRMDFNNKENPGYDFIELEREVRNKWNRRI